MSYDYNYIVKYENNDEYRRDITKVFIMDIPIIENNDDCIFYDNPSVMRGIDYIYYKTSNNDAFLEIYEKSAATLFSTDKQIGACILFSYHFFEKFHKCLVEFFNNNEKFEKSSENYKELLKLL